MEISRNPSPNPTYDITERYCSHMDANVILTRINNVGSPPGEYRCLSSHLCQRDAGTPCKHTGDAAFPEAQG